MTQRSDPGLSKVPFTGWVPIPRRIFNDVASGILTPSEGRVEMALYERANPTTWLATFRDLDTLARRLAWEYSESYLSKVLRSLREKQRIAFETTPGKTTHPYVIALLFDRPDQSEESPSTIGQASPSSTKARRRMERPQAASSSQGQSEHEEAVVGSTSPSAAHVSPSREEPAIPVAERDPGEGVGVPVRAPRDVLEKQNTHREVNVLGRKSQNVGSETTRADEVVDLVVVESTNDLLATTGRLLAAIGLEADEPRVQTGTIADGQLGLGVAAELGRSSKRPPWA